jgi:hypothetical protein
MNFEFGGGKENLGGTSKTSFAGMAIASVLARGFASCSQSSYFSTPLGLCACLAATGTGLQQKNIKMGPCRYTNEHHTIEDLDRSSIVCCLYDPSFNTLTLLISTV